MALRCVLIARPWFQSLGAYSHANCRHHLPWKVNRRCFATTDNSPRTPQLAQLLRAIQTRDLPAMSESFLEWTDAIALESPQFDEAVANEVHLLPHTTIAEIIRNLDPIAHPALDIAHGLRITLGQTQYVDATDLADEFGVRPQHRQVLKGMQTLLEVKGCPAEADGLLTPDIETMIRYAGVVGEWGAIINLFGQTPRLEGFAGRSSRTIHEFLKAMYSTEPAYHQFDDTRVMLRGRDKVRGEPHEVGLMFNRVQEMDRLRFNINALLREPWGRDEANIALRKARQMGKRGLTKDAFRMQWARWRGDGVYIDEEFLCTAMLGFARSFALNEIVHKIFEHRYGIKITHSHQTRGIHITGGFVFPPGHPFYPTQRFLHAMVDALGSMGRIELLLQLLKHFSSLHGLPITHELWSKILNWTYINASKPFSTFRRQLGEKQSHLRNSTRHCHRVISMMTSKPFKLTLNFDDCLVLTKILIVDYDIEQALDVIRQQLIPHYEARLRDHQEAIMDEVLRNDAASFSPLANSHRRRRAEVLLDHTWHRIQHLFDRLIKQISNYKPLLTDPAFANFIPDLVREFRPFLSKNVRYRTEQGLVTLWRSEDEPGVSRGKLELVDREMLPTPYSSSTKDRRKRSKLTDTEWKAEMDEQRKAMHGRKKELEEEPAVEAMLLNEEQIAMNEDLLMEQAELQLEGDSLPPPAEQEMEKPDLDKIMSPENVTKRRVVRQFTRIPAKREADLTMPAMEAEWDMETWRRKLVRELTL